VLRVARDAVLTGKNEARDDTKKSMSAALLEPLLPAATVAPVPAETALRGLDPESRTWLDDLRADGARRDGAVSRLHALLLKAARFEIARRRAAFPHLRGNDLDDLAHQSADDALVSVLARLDDFRGLSRFTTWAYKFALYEAGAKVRRRAWQGREIPLDDAGWERFAAPDSPDGGAERAELLAALRECIAALTAHQRRVFTALALNDVPIDVLAERLETTRGALYKTLHDARARLRAQLAERGFEIEGRSG
jgi:RNA polymerase sigma-70 factor, ECF subfamily